jgi:hypothetical protein
MWLEESLGSLNLRMRISIPIARRVNCIIPFDSFKNTTSLKCYHILGQEPPLSLGTIDIAGRRCEHLAGNDRKSDSLVVVVVVVK